MKRPEGVTVIAVLHILNALLLGLAALVILAVPLPIVWFNVTDASGRFWSLFGLGLSVALIVGAAGVALLAGAGLFKMQAWARWLTVALALLALPAFPIGSLIGALTLAYLLQPNTSEAFIPLPHRLPVQSDKR